MRQSTATLQRKCDACEEEDKGAIQRSAESADPLAGAPAPESVRRALSGPGQKLDETTRNLMESGFGHDFSSVRIHNDSAAAASARDVAARAYTLGEHIAFNQDAYQPGSAQGKRLLAHELAHVVQQTQPGAGQAVSRVPDATGVKNSDYSFSSNCGWIDWGHANPGLAKNLIAQVQQASDELNNTAQGPGSANSTPQMKASKFGVVFSSASLQVTLARALSAEEVLSVALSMFKNLSIIFEIQRQWTDWFSHSAFSQEDLPSNVISFYRAARGFSTADIRQFCGAMDADASLQEYNRNHDFKKNPNFSPVGASGAWPAALSTIDDTKGGALYSISSVSVGGPALDSLVDGGQFGVDHGLRGVGRFGGGDEGGEQILATLDHRHGACALLDRVIGLVEDLERAAGPFDSRLQEELMGLGFGEYLVQHVGQRSGHGDAGPPGEFCAVIGVDARGAALPLGQLVENRRAHVTFALRALVGRRGCAGVGRRGRRGGVGLGVILELGGPFRRLAAILITEPAVEGMASAWGVSSHPQEYLATNGDIMNIVVTWGTLAAGNPEASGARMVSSEGFKLAIPQFRTWGNGAAWKAINAVCPAPIAIKREEVRDPKRAELKDLVLIRTPEAANDEPNGFYIVPKPPVMTAAGALGTDKAYYALYEPNGVPTADQIPRLRHYVAADLTQLIDGWDNRGLSALFGAALGFMLKAVKLIKTTKKPAKGPDTAVDTFLADPGFTAMEAKDADRAKLIRDSLSR